jgi:hypothetical protein
MNKFKKMMVLPLVSVALFSCIQDEPLNAEADILECNLSDDKDILLTKGDTIRKVFSNEENISILVQPGSDLTKRSPKFILTPGATVSPESGSEHDFSDNKVVKYVVTSEDGEWKRDYFVSYNSFELPSLFHFDNYKLDRSGKYQVVYEVVDDVEVMGWWGSGNPGYSMASSSGPEGYPTVIIDKGYQGTGLQLVTRSAGSFGSMVGMPIAPGNLFLGSFNVGMALKQPLKATCFGLPFAKVPKEIKGWYKFKSGEVMTDANNKEIEGVDDYNIYAMFYENTDEKGNQVVLDGTNSSTSPYLVLYAEVEKGEPTDEWLPFSIKFESRNGKTIDEKRLKSYGYNFSLVFSSSRRGDIFQGAVGSTLCVDEVSIICE